MPSAEAKDVEMAEAPKNEEDRFLRMSIEFLDDVTGNSEEEQLNEEQKADKALEDVKAALSGASGEVRKTARALRTILIARRRLTPSAVADIVPQDVQHLVEKKEKKEKEEKKEEEKEEKEEEEEKEAGAEAEALSHLLLVTLLIDASDLIKAKEAATLLVEKLKKERFVGHTLDPVRAKAYFYYARVYELQGKLADVRTELLGAYRSATLAHGWTTQASVLNLLLRNYLAHKLYDQAHKLVSKTTFRDGGQANETARYLYYTGRIKATQLEYTEAYKSLVQAGRKAPQHTALGFRKTVAKLLVIVQLLMGEVPEKQVFSASGMRGALRPYYQLTQAVRVGDLALFQAVVKEHESVFQADGNHTLIQRLRRNVIKTGLRKINASYSSIRLADVCAKLCLDNAQDAEFIVAKAIRDGVIDATLDHANGTLHSKDSADVYSTQEPLEAFHRRISFCLNLHNDAVVAMRFPDVPKKPQEKPKDLKDLVEELVADEEDEDDEMV